MQITKMSEIICPLLVHIYVDIDECARGTHECNQTCNNTIGSYTCGCNAGYRLAPDGRNCEGLFVCCDEVTCHLF